MTKRGTVRGPGGAQLTDGDDIDLDREEVRVGGRRFTEADADALAEELERRTRPGQPSLSGEGESPQIRVRVARQEYDRLAAIAKAEHSSISAIVRRAVQHELAAADSPSPGIT